MISELGAPLADARPDQAAELHGRAAVRRARLRPRRRARRQARGARARGDRHRSATAPTCSAIRCRITSWRAPKKLPTLTVVANNQQWLAVRQSTLDVFPDGHAAKANVMALTELKPSPDYEKVVETCGGRGEKVEGPKQLLPALRALARGRARRHAGDAQRADAGATIAHRQIRRRPAAHRRRPEAPLAARRKVRADVPSPTRRPPAKWRDEGAAREIRRHELISMGTQEHAASTLDCAAPWLSVGRRVAERASSSAKKQNPARSGA